MWILWRKVLVRMQLWAKDLPNQQCWGRVHDSWIARMSPGKQLQLLPAGSAQQYIWQHWTDNHLPHFLSAKNSINNNKRLLTAIKTTNQHIFFQVGYGTSSISRKTKVWLLCYVKVPARHGSHVDCSSSSWSQGRHSGLPETNPSLEHNFQVLLTWTV